MNERETVPAPSAGSGPSTQPHAPAPELLAWLRGEAIERPTRRVPAVRAADTRAIDEDW